MSGGVVTEVSSHETLARALFPETADPLANLSWRIAEGGADGSWFDIGMYKSTDSDLEETQADVTATLQACIEALDPELPVPIRCTGQFDECGPEISSLPSAASQLLTLAFVSLEIEGGEDQGHATVVADVKREGYEYRFIIESSFWEEEVPPTDEVGAEEEVPTTTEWRVAADLLITKLQVAEPVTECV